MHLYHYHYPLITPAALLYTADWFRFYYRWHYILIRDILKCGPILTLFLYGDGDIWMGGPFDGMNSVRCSEHPVK